MTLTVGGTEVAVILVETKSGFKVSFRSRCELDCSRIAEQFGGGGHRRAAGAQLKEPLATGREKVLTRCGRRWRGKGQGPGARGWGCKSPATASRGPRAVSQFWGNVSCISYTRN